jgi:hypothetical protein
MIPKRKHAAVQKLAHQLAVRRVHLHNGKSIIRDRANHASYVLEERGGIKIRPLSYGENSYRGRSSPTSVHAEQHALRNLNANQIRNGKKYSILVIKISNGRNRFGLSSCCNRCQLHLKLAPVNISRVYYSTPEGIVMKKPSELEPHTCSYDRDHKRRTFNLNDEQSECNTDEEETDEALGNKKHRVKKT